MEALADLLRRLPGATLLLFVLAGVALAQEPPRPVAKVTDELEAAAKAGDAEALRRLIPELGKIGTRRAIDPLLEAFDAVAADERCYRAAREALASLTDPLAWGRVTNAARHGKGLGLRLLALEAIERRGAEADDEALVAALKDDAPAVRRRALLALGGRRRPAAARALIDFATARDREPDVEHQVALAALDRLFGQELRLGAEYASLWKDGPLPALPEKRAPQKKAPRDPTPERPWAGAVTAEAALFEEPRLEAKVVLKLLAGTEVQATGREAGFVRVRATVGGAALEGWVAAQAVALTTPPAPQDAPDEPAGPSLYREPLVGKAIVFLLDCSGSMEDAKLFAGAQAELCRAIESLPAGTRFEVISFSSRVAGWSDGLVAATPENKASATKWVRGADAAGSTRLDRALTRALAIDAVDTVVVVTDGRPTIGDDPIPDDDVLELIDRANRTVQARISAFGFPTAHHSLLEAIARRTGGRYRKIGG